MITTRRAHARPARPAAAVPRRFRAVPPAQERSRETLGRFAEAVESLPRTRTIEEISVEPIVRRAGRSIGSSCARFRSKDALLPHLYRRCHERLEADVRDRLALVAWDGLDPGPTVIELMRFIVRMYDERRGLLRAPALFARMRPEALPADVVWRRRRIYEPMVGLLARHRGDIAHADPAWASRFAVFLASSIAREMILFEGAPHSRVTPLSRDELLREMTRAAHAYLTHEGRR
jgi:AcrR family transcriptional regulator